MFVKRREEKKIPWICCVNRFTTNDVKAKWSRGFVYESGIFLVVTLVEWCTYLIFSMFKLFGKLCQGHFSATLVQTPQIPPFRYSPLIPLRSLAALFTAESVKLGWKSLPSSNNRDLSVCRPEYSCLGLVRDCSLLINTTVMLYLSWNEREKLTSMKPVHFFSSLNKHYFMPRAIINAEQPMRNREKHVWVF